MKRAMLNVTRVLAIANATAEVRAPKWTFEPIFYTSVVITSFILNGAVIILIIGYRHLHTPFNVYVVNLLLGNFLYSFLHSPAEIANSLYSVWPFSEAYCRFYLYMSYVFEAGIQQCHALITLNRMWASESFQFFCAHTNKYMDFSYKIYCLLQ